ncbi:unnamed protein product [Hydatigera taeniaeformis]|uniref:Fork-head domain-containing protein n=1 Tax=Hydatigena taeniaeformis TaxID=6205 RepID=A0A0R3WI84_HYDTA|nr:unnamed protein product [Hydatigera taeniaeformis]
MEERGDSRVPPPRVRIFECARDGIQELFNRDSSKATKPMDERNFPKSFWIPPTKEHSKCSGSLVENNQDGFCISHRKSNSSPSCIGANAAYLSEPIDHNRQKSLDTTQNLARNPKGSPMMCNAGLLPHTDRGYNPFNTLLLYVAPFIIRIRDSLIASHLQYVNCRQSFKWRLTKISKFIFSITKQNKLLGTFYLSSRVLRFDPRIPPDEQKWGMTIEELDQIHINYARRQKLDTHSLEGHRQLPASPMSVLSPIDSGGMSGGGGGGESTSCCSTLPSSPSSTAGHLVSGSGGGGGVRPASVPRMQHPGAFSMTHIAPTPRALPMNLLPPQGSKPMPSRQQQHQQQQQHIAHTKSSSQPVAMTVSGVSGHADSCMGGGGGGSSGGYALGPSSSLTRLHHPNYGATLFPSSEPLPATSSGHLAQDMEELSLSRGTGETPLPHLQQMFCTTPLLPLLSQSSMPPPGTAPTANAGEYGTGGSVATQQISSAQHSHQSSMDSGVGPSVAGGHSIPSANQTPEHTKVACFDSSESFRCFVRAFVPYTHAHTSTINCSFNQLTLILWFLCQNTYYVDSYHITRVAPNVSDTELHCVLLHVKVPTVETPW